MGDEFGRRLRDLVDGIRIEASTKATAHADDPASARARRRHLEKIALEEARKILREAEPVLASLGMRPRAVPEEMRVEGIPGARMPEKFPPWLTLRCRPPAYETVRVAVLAVTWRVDDPRTPLPEAPNTLRFVASDDSPAGVAEIRDFLSIALEDFATNVARFDVLPRS